MRKGPANEWPDITPSPFSNCSFAEQLACVLGTRTVGLGDWAFDGILLKGNTYGADAVIRQWDATDDVK
jgi:hypothetical protein